MNVSHDSFLITKFDSKQTTGKIPFSPFDDKTFVFSTATFKTNEEGYNALVSNFILNIPLDIQKPIREKRLAQALEPYFQKTLNFIILDIDCIKTEFAKNKIIEYFKEFRVILGESRSYDGVENFNLKGLLFTESLSLIEARQLLVAIARDIEAFGILDEASLRRATFNAPIQKNKVLFNNQDGKLAQHRKDFSYFERARTNSSDVSNTHVNLTQDIDFTLLSDISTINDLCLNIFTTLGFKAETVNSNGSISFSHFSEIKTKGGFYWFNTSPYIMHHPNSFRSVNIYQKVKTSEIGKQLLKAKTLNYSELLTTNFKYDHVYTFNEQFLQKENKIQIIDQFLHKRNGLLSIKSPMGSGKSNVISEIIEQSLSEERRILIITNRISVAEDYYTKYTINNNYNFKLYNKDFYNIGDSLIVQFDSLFKYSMKFFDLIIIDEFMSLMVHARNNLSNTSSNIIKLFSTFSKKLVIADAFLTGYELNILLNSQPQKGDNNNLILINNEYRDSTNLLLYKSRPFFISNIINVVKKSKDHEKISVSCTSLDMIYGLRYILEKQGFKVLTLTATTPKTTKTLIYELFQKVENEDDYHDKYKVILFSPTLTVGVSNLNNITDHFHYDSSMSCDVISSIQMIKRSRNAKNIHMFIKDNKNLNNNHLDIESLRDFYMSKVIYGTEQLDFSHSFMFENDVYGDCKLSQNGVTALHIDLFTNIMEFNHKEALLHLLGTQFSNEVHHLNGKNHTAEPGIDTFIKMQKVDEKSQLECHINDYFKLTSIEKYKIAENLKSLSDVKKQRAFNKFIEIEEKFNIPDPERLYDLLQLSISTDIIEKIQYYELFMRNLSEVQIREYQSRNISNNNQDELIFLEKFNNIRGHIIKTYYTKRELNSIEKHLQQSLIYVLEKIGYSYTNSTFRQNTDVIKYYKFLKV